MHVDADADVDAVPLVDVGAALLQPDVGVARLAAAGAALLIQPDVGAVRLAAAGVARLAAAGVARLVAAGVVAEPATNAKVKCFVTWA